MALFRRKHPHPLAGYQQGGFHCSQCGRLLPLDKYPALFAASCQKCKGVTFVPMKVGSWLLFEPLGGGGMGSVYKAYRIGEPETVVAVKILPRAEKGNQDYAEHLRLEAEIGERLLSHPCIVNVIEGGVADGEHYLVMDFVDGERLDKRIERLGRIPENELLFIGLRLLSAETHIYNRGYLFRDLKPQNIILQPQSGAYLFDYGICIPVERPLEEDSDVITGSPLYFPPERVTGEGEDATSEIYSMGMVLYHAVTGKPYFTSQEIETITRRHLSALRLSGKETKMKDISPDLAAVIDRMIRRDPAERYQSFADVESALMRVVFSRFRLSNDGQLLSSRLIGDLHG